MTDKASLILMLVVVGLLIALFVISFLRKKKYSTELNTMREELKLGDRVMIDTGVVGELVDSYEEDGYKYFVLKSGRGNNVGYFAVHANAIYYVFGKDNQTKSNIVVSAPKIESSEEAETGAANTEQKTATKTAKKTTTKKGAKQTKNK